MSSFWSGYIIIITLGALGACTWILLANRTRPADGEVTTGHSSDGIEEYDNPLPFWWLLMFCITLVFALGYLLFFPGLGNFKGLLGWSQVSQWEQRVADAQQRYGEVFARYRQEPVESLASNTEAMKMAQRLFANNCSQCHGLDARGSFGFPNLTDDEWIWGDSAEQIHHTIVNGRQGIMPAWGSVLGEDGVERVALYVQSLSGIIEADARSAAGKQQFETICGTCHGLDGSGNQALGAPNLRNDAWLYGPQLEQIKHTIRSGRSNAMPAHGELLNEDKIHLLTAYVLSLQ